MTSSQNKIFTRYPVPVVYRCVIGGRGVNYLAWEFLCFLCRVNITVNLLIKGRAMYMPGMSTDETVQLVSLEIYRNNLAGPASVHTLWELQIQTEHEFTYLRPCLEAQTSEIGPLAPSMLTASFRSHSFQILTQGSCAVVTICSESVRNLMHFRGLPPRRILLISACRESKLIKRWSTDQKLPTHDPQGQKIANHTSCMETCTRDSDESFLTYAWSKSHRRKIVKHRWKLLRHPHQNYIACINGAILSESSLQSYNA